MTCGKLSERKLKRLYSLMSAQMTDFDCGKLCAPSNNGIPHCCDISQCVPILFNDEFKWLGRKASFWKKMPVKSRHEKEMVEESVDYITFSTCPGVTKCKRKLRALVCRAFPFEPYLKKDGKVQGLVFIKSGESCPLTKMPRKKFNDQYISNAIKFWQEIVDIFPEERDLYIEESKKRDRSAAKKGKSVRIFR